MSKGMTKNGHRGAKQRVLIAGGGIAGIEAALALRDLAGDRVEVRLHDPRREFVFRPFAVGEPYGAARIFHCDLRRLAASCGASFHADGVVAIDAGRRIAISRDGDRLSYDHFVAACGVRMLPSVPGAVPFWGVADEGRIAAVIAALRGGRLRRLALTMPAGHSWALPLYELALMGAAALEKAGATHTRITVVTPEEAPLEIFGIRASEQMMSLLEERGIEVLAAAHPVHFDGGRLRIARGEEIEADAVISLPRLEGRRIDGIPHDPDGLVGVDEHGKTIGLERVFAAGDATTFPIKQGGVAAQQADCVAEAIAAEAGVEIDPRPFDPILRGVLWAGTAPRYLYGRPTGGHDETSSLSERPQWPLRNGKVAGRYITPFLRAFAGESSSTASAGSPSAR
jgi:sulfide:quinone oxidoreductase